MFWRRPIGLLIVLTVGLQSADARSLRFLDGFRTPLAASRCAPLSEALSLRSTCAHLGAPSLALGRVLRRLADIDWRARLRSDEALRDRLELFTTVMAAAVSGGALLGVRIPEQSYLLRIRTLLAELGDISEVPLSDRQKRAVELVRSESSVSAIADQFGTGRQNAFNGVKEALRMLERERDIRNREAQGTPVTSRPISDLRLKSHVEGIVRLLLAARTIGDLAKLNETELELGLRRAGPVTLAHIKDRLWKTGQIELQPPPLSPRESRRMRRRGGTLAVMPLIGPHPPLPEGWNLWPVLALVVLATSTFVLILRTHRFNPAVLRSA